MLLVHQTGCVKVGEVVRYTLTYTPAHDRVLPLPSILHLKIRNTSAIPLRAAYLHGPYTLHVSSYPSIFNPNKRLEAPRTDGVPEYEPHLKAGGGWNATLKVPEGIRNASKPLRSPKSSTSRASTQTSPELPQSVTWIIEVSSQIIFSNSATVHYEVLVGRDYKSVDVGFTQIPNGTSPSAGRVEDHQTGRDHRHNRHPAQPRGVFSTAIKLVVDDTVSLWNKPALPEWGPRQKTVHSLEEATTTSTNEEDTNTRDGETTRKRKRVHLVIVTHGLHSNIGADMLYLKESIDEAAREAREASRRRRAASRQATTVSDSTPARASVGREEAQSQSKIDKVSDECASESDDEQIIVRGYADNAVRTEKGIKYLGKRLAKYVLTTTHRQDSFVASRSQTTAKTIARSLTGQAKKSDDPGSPSVAQSSMPERAAPEVRLPYQITSISFIGHSLGGLTQTYAVAYIQKHCPHFFDEIKPINFIALATPFLGLSNENPIYVKFALDSGLVGRTGKDLGLTWRAPTLARSGWGAVVGGLGSVGNKTNVERDVAGTKPLLRILPTGPAHKALRKFRNRTVYSNVVNDGIVPLRTSCLLFLDWSGLGRVEKARRENGLVGTMAGWGWAELTGQNSGRRDASLVSEAVSGPEVVSRAGGDERRPDHASPDAEVPQPPENATKDESVGEMSSTARGMAGLSQKPEAHGLSDQRSAERDPETPSHLWDTFLAMFRPPRRQSPQGRPNSHRDSSQSDKTMRMLERSQTVKAGSEAVPHEDGGSSTDEQRPGTAGTDGSQAMKKQHRSSVHGWETSPEDAHSPVGPPKTSIFESAGDILNPSLPSTEFLIDPSRRSRTIFHDRVYHPDDIPPAPVDHRRTGFSGSSSTGASPVEGPDSTSGTGSMKVEEKIARAYHRDMAWRKVLVRLEPDAHNNMIVRRRFANAYGWPVVKHLVDTHFGDTTAARTRDDEESGQERAKKADQGVGPDGEELTYDATDAEQLGSEAQVREGTDELGAVRGGFRPTTDRGQGADRPLLSRADSAQWSDTAFDVTDEEEGEGMHVHGGKSPSQHRTPSTITKRASPLGKIKLSIPGAVPKADGPLSVPTT